MTIFKYRWQKIYAGAVVIFCSLFAAVYWYGSSHQQKQLPAEVFIDTTAYRALPKPEFKYGLLINNLVVEESMVKRNQRFTDLLEGYHVQDIVHQQINLVSRSVFDFRKITQNKKITLIHYPDSLKSLKAIVYEQSPVDYYVFHLEDSLIIETCQHPVEIVEKGFSAIIDFSLAQTIEQFGISNELTNRFVDVFAWQIDFHRLQKGDRFKILYDEIYVNGSAVGIKGIKGIYFEHEEKPFWAIPFDQGNGIDYFNERGESLRKELLKFPIEYTRISSRYSLRRFHPVDKVYRAHRGTDFSAPTGTPIRSVGDGVILEAQYKRNNGNYVKVKHNGTYATQYLHMSKIARGIRPGTQVKQGQIIGYVGSTGLSTGPHLCYRFWKNGVQVDALKVDLPPAEPIQPEMNPQFELAKNDIVKKLDMIVMPPSIEASLASTKY
ncbi:MAG: peptidoglycan DD-metalloendopeptidase family protein [Flammeovirgaceae bacterium]|nr:peptidoglycan DD-metalloendopeptidase family protein [Flammeovirgaceae bacterium]